MNLVGGFCGNPPSRKNIFVFFLDKSRYVNTERTWSRFRIFFLKPLRKCTRLFHQDHDCGQEVSYVYCIFCFCLSTQTQGCVRSTPSAGTLSLRCFVLKIMRYFSRASEILGVFFFFLCAGGATTRRRRGCWGRLSGCWSSRILRCGASTHVGDWRTFFSSR